MGDAKDTVVPDGRLNIDFGKTFQVLVGPTKQAFTVYEDLLIRRSTFFKAARSKAWAGTTSTVDLPVDVPRIFGNWLNCIYFKEVAKHPDGSEFQCLEYIELWTLADRLGDFKTANLVVDKLGQITAHKYLPDAEAMDYCYENTLEGSALRRLCVDSELFAPEGWHTREDWEQYPDQFLRDMGIASMLLRTQAKDKRCHIQEIVKLEDPRVLTCNYHQHDSDEDRCTGKWTPAKDRR